MIKKETILKTGVCYWSDEDQCFVVESPLFARTAGIGDTPREAKGHFRHMIDIAYEDLRANKIAGLNKSGRPAKNGMQLGCKVQSETIESIRTLADDLEISQGEVVDLVLFFYSVRSRELPEMPRQDQIVRMLTSMERRMRAAGMSTKEPGPGSYVASTSARERKTAMKRTTKAAARTKASRTKRRKGV